MAADDDALLDAGEERAQPLVRREPRDRLHVAAGRAVAEADRADPVHVDHRVEWKIREEPELLLAEPLGHPKPAPMPQLRIAAGPAGEVEDSVGIPADEPRAERLQPLERLRRHRPGGHVPADEDQVDGLGRHLREHGLERRQVPVDVVESGDAHACRFAGCGSSLSTG